MSPIVYLAGPYTHADPKVREARFRALTHAAAQLVAAGHIVYSPITHSHPIDLSLKSDGVTHLESAFWVAYDEAFMQHCSMIVVLMLDGWSNSSGVRREIEYFTERQRPIVWMNPDAKGIALVNAA